MKKFRELVKKVLKEEIVYNKVLKEEIVYNEPKQKFNGTPQQFLRSIGVKIKKETPFENGVSLDFYNNDYANFAYEDLHSVNFTTVYNFELSNSEIIIS